MLKRLQGTQPICTCHSYAGAMRNHLQFSIQTGAENGPYQVQKCPPLTGPVLGPRAQQFHLPIQTSDEITPTFALSASLFPLAGPFTCQFKGAMKKDAENHSRLFFDAFSGPNGAIFPYSYAHRSFGAILGAWSV